MSLDILLQKNFRLSGRFYDPDPVQKNITLASPDEQNDEEDNSDKNDEYPELEALLSSAITIRDSLFKNRNFHKAASKLSVSEAKSLKNEHNLLSNLVIELFMKLPMKSLRELKSDSCAKLNKVQDCFERLQKKLKDFENLHSSNKTLPLEIDQDHSHEHFNVRKEESPPFDISPDEENISPNIFNKQVHDKSCIPPSSFDKVDSLNVSSIGNQGNINQNANLRQSPKKFVFKKPGAANITQPLPQTIANPSNDIAQFSTSNSEKVNFSRNQTCDSGYDTSCNGKFSFKGLENSSVKTSSSSGTQFIEDFHTQDNSTKQVGCSAKN